MLIPTQTFNYWYVISSLSIDDYQPQLVLAASQAKPESQNINETITVFRPDKDDFETIPQWRIYFTVIIKPKN